MTEWHRPKKPCLLDLEKQQRGEALNCFQVHQQFPPHFCSHFPAFCHLCSQSIEKFNQFGSIFQQRGPRHAPRQQSKARQVFAPPPRCSQAFAGLTGQLHKAAFLPSSSRPTVTPSLLPLPILFPLKRAPELNTEPSTWGFAAAKLSLRQQGGKKGITSDSFAVWQCHLC